MAGLELNSRQLAACRRKIVRGIRNGVNKANARGVVIGLSGGIDSATVAKLASEAVKDVHALMMPEKAVSDPRDLKDAVKLAEQLGIKYSVIGIDDVLNAVSENFTWEVHDTRLKRNALANLKPRIRMVYEYLAANLDRRLVLGTTNKTELLLGYFTKHGDGACDMEPIGGLYKTRVKQLAGHLGIPDCIIQKTPTAGLWKGQTDESEIGLKYDEIDSILHCLVDCRLPPAEAVKKTGLSGEKVGKIAAMVAGSAHKRKPPGVISV